MAGIWRSSYNAWITRYGEIYFTKYGQTRHIGIKKIHIHKWKKLMDKKPMTIYPIITLKKSLKDYDVSAEDKFIIRQTSWTVLQDRKTIVCDSGIGVCNDIDNARKMLYKWKKTHLRLRETL